jgi:energy-coupling factor transporter ATP-binding protein EcfA2
VRLVELRLRNYRCYKDEITVRFDDLTAFVGKNDAGKSTIMEALDIFFNETGPDENDACKHGQSNDLCISAVFSELPASIILDQDVATTLSAEYLLNSNGELEIHKIFNGALAKPKITCLKLIAQHPTLPKLDDLYSLNNGDLKKRAKDVGANLTNIDMKVNSQLRAAIRATATDLCIQQKEIMLHEGNGASFWKGIQAHLPVFALFRADRSSTDQDPEAQDPLNAAIKEAIRLQEAELSKVQVFVEQEVKKIASLTVSKLKEMDPSLASTLNPELTIKPWQSLFKVSITGDANIPINKRGSGVRRLILLGFFRAKAELQRTRNNKQSIIYGIEEPETSQHPRNQRLLMSVLQELSATEQVVITTHTPMLARVLPDTALRFINIKPDGSREILPGGSEAINAAIAESLGVLPDHNIKMFIGVEGKYDIPFLRNISNILIAGGEVIPNLTDLELDGLIIFLPLGGSSLVQWSDRLRGLHRPEFHLYDRDTAPPQQATHQADVDRVNLRPDCRAFSTSKREVENYVHFEAINQALQNANIAARLTQKLGDFEDVPTVLFNLVNIEVAQSNMWGETRAKDFLNNAALSYMTKAMLDQIDPQGEVLGWFQTMEQMLAGVP